MQITIMYLLFVLAQKKNHFTTFMHIALHLRINQLMVIMYDNV